jgi:hypothetical protein
MPFRRAWMTCNSHFIHRSSNFDIPLYWSRKKKKNLMFRSVVRAALTPLVSHLRSDEIRYTTLLSTASVSIISAALAVLFLLHALITLGRLMREVECWIYDDLCSYNPWRRHSGAETCRGDTMNCFTICILLSFIKCICWSLNWSSLDNLTNSTPSHPTFLTSILTLFYKNHVGLISALLAYIFTGT